MDTARLDDVCRPRVRRGRHKQLVANELRVGTWLEDVCSELKSSTLLSLRITHPSPEADDIVRQDLDPSTAHVLIGLARLGVNVAPALYVGIVCQHIGTAWHGLAGAYLPVCTCNAESNGRAASTRLAAFLPPTSVAVAPSELPVGLAPRAGWWEGRLRSAHRVDSSSGGTWAVRQVSELNLAEGAAAVIRTGPRTTAESTLLYLETEHELSALAPALSEGSDSTAAATRIGPRELLRRLAGAAGEPLSALVHGIKVDGVPTDIVGWGITEDTERREVTRSASRLAARWAAELPIERRTEVRFWSAPRLAAHGAIDGPALLCLLDERRVNGRDTSTNA